ncbi:MAG: hypothetical protein ACRD6X_16800 [Pyrinomonadaceae bacterium]
MLNQLHRVILRPGIGQKMILLVLASIIFTHVLLSQGLPKSLTAFLNRNYKGWKLAGECYPEEKENKRILVGDFDGNGKRDYAVKFVRGKKGFLMAFLANGPKWKPFYLHIWDDPNEARYSDLMMFDPGDSWEMGGSPKFKYETPADFRCESDVGGPHTYRNGKFIAY